MKIVINFLLRKSRKADDGKTSICVRITYQGNRIELSTGIYSSTNHWDTSRQRIKDKVIGARVDNKRLDRIKTEVKDTFNQLRSTNEDFDVNWHQQMDKSKNNQYDEPAMTNAQK